MIALLLLLVVPVLEIWAAVVVAQSIGAFATALVLVSLSVLGVVLVRSEGLGVWRRVNAELAAGRPPTESLLDGLMVVAGGLLLIVPGFLTAIPGLLLLFPPTRSLLRPVLQRSVERRASRSATLGGFSFVTVGPDGMTAGGRRTWGGAIVDADSHETPTGSPGGYAEVIDVEVHRPDELGPTR